MKIYLLGAINPETIRTVNAVQLTNSDIEFALLDDDPTKHGTTFYGISAGTVARGDIPDNSLVLSNSTTFITNKWPFL